jgi:hypothetical protein
LYLVDHQVTIQSTNRLSEHNFHASQDKRGSPWIKKLFNKPSRHAQLSEYVQQAADFECARWAGTKLINASRTLNQSNWGEQMVQERRFLTLRSLETFTSTPVEKWANGGVFVVWIFQVLRTVSSIE